jgi:Orsellinic acid/F9775 biosynthesis cluster protein D
MDGTLNQYIIYNPEYQVLICKEHQCGITPSYIGRHFRNDHKNVPLTVRQNIVSGITALELCAPENVTEVSEIIRPIPGLEIVNGYRCMALGLGVKND